MTTQRLTIEQAQAKGLTSLDIAAEKRAQLKALLPEAFAGEALDLDQLRRALGDFVEAGKERYGLNWPGKAECMKVIQAPSIATLRPCREESVNFDTTENLFIEGDNLEVLKLLQKAYFGKVKMIYIDPPYNTGKEFIYPDKYSETLETYLAYTGQIDDEGRRFATDTDAGGRRHARWLSMMYPRLYLARNLLREDGVIFISIDDNEQANLKLLCDLVFGEENFVCPLIWKSRQIVDSRNQTNASIDHEYILVYAKNQTEFKLSGKAIDKSKYSNPDNDPRGAWMSNSILGLANKSQRPNLHYAIEDPKTGRKYECQPESGWRYSRDTMAEKIADGRIVFPSKIDGRPREKKFLSELTGEFTGFSSVLDCEIGYTLHGTKEVRELFNDKYFDFPKPSSLIKSLILQGTDNEDIILDFFSGSATTAHAVMQLNAEDGGNRKFIMVQLPEKTDPDSEAHKAGFNTIADIGKERIRRAAKKIAEEQAQRVIPAKAGTHDLPLMMDSRVRGNDTGCSGNDTEGERPPLDLGFKVFKLAPSNFRIWDGEKALEGDSDTQQTDTLLRMLEEHVDHINAASTPEDILYELLLKAGFSLTLPIEKRVMAGKDVYAIEDGAMLICLDKHLTDAVIDAMAATHPIQVICLDEGFQGNDQLKANAVQTFKSRALHQESEIVFRTV